MATPGEENPNFEMQSNNEADRGDVYENVVGRSAYETPVTTQGAMNKQQPLTMEVENGLHTMIAKVRRLVFAIGVVVVINFMITVATLAVVVSMMTSENIRTAEQDYAAVQRLESNKSSII